ncbi:MAG: tetratricopeptide repeat protein [Chitinivibrionales bacterium]|nr:tetratricopeptide repeat protein [Chitinivibrionales bacterium]
MNIQYSKKKQDIKRDPFIEFLLNIKEKATQHSTIIIAGVAGIILAMFLVMGYNHMAASSLRKAQKAFGNAMIAYTSSNNQKAIEALALVTENHGNTPQAAYAAYLLGHILREQDRYDEAINWFEMAKNKSKGKSFITGGALEATATCYESMGELDKAVSYFEKALQEEHYGYRAPALRWKLALINKSLNNHDKAVALCNEIVSDTSAVELKQDAENLLIELNTKKG